MSTASIWGKKLEKKTRYHINLPANYKFLTIFGSLGVKFLIDDDWLYVGRGSYGAIQRIQSYKNHSQGRLLLKVGDFSEFSDCDIVLGGEHDNSSMFNLTLNCFPHVSSDISANYKSIDNAPTSYAKDIIEIDSNVLVSTKSLILSGSKIGHGTIVGANTVVTNELLPNGVYIGSPAKFIKNRFTDNEWEIYAKVNWTSVDIHDLFYLGALIRKHEFSILDDMIRSVRKCENNSFVVFRAGRNNKRLIPKQIEGVEINSKFYMAKDLPKEMLNYFSQANDLKTTNIDWIPDPFDYFLF